MLKQVKFDIPKPKFKNNETLTLTYKNYSGKDRISLKIIDFEIEGTWYLGKRMNTSDKKELSVFIEEVYYITEIVFQLGDFGILTEKAEGSTLIILESEINNYDIVGIVAPTYSVYSEHISNAMRSKQEWQDSFNNKFGTRR